MGSKHPYSELSTSNEELLTSGSFSDVTVECNARKWNLHRNILSARSGFFQKALEPNGFKESTGFHIDIREQHPDRVYWVIYFIYTGRLPDDALSLLEDDDTAMKSCIELFEIADFFTLSTLCTHARDVLLEHMVENAEYTQSIIRGFLPSSTIDECVDEDFVDRYFQAVKMAYSIPLKSFDALRDALLLYPELTRYAVVRTTPFRKRLLEDPEVTGFALRVLGNAFRTDVGVAGVTIPRCRDCSYSTEVIVNFMEVRGHSQGYCRHCKPVGNINVIQDLGGEALEELK